MKNFFKKNNSQKKGFLMIEVIIASSIIVISVLVAMSVVNKSILISNQSVHSTQATFLLEEGAEAVRVLRDNAWTNISGLTVNTNYYPTYVGNTWTLSATPSQVGNFTRTVKIYSVNRDAGTLDISTNGTDDPGTKLVKVNVSWIESGQVMSKELSFYLFNIFL